MNAKLLAGRLFSVTKKHPIWILVILVALGSAVFQGIRHFQINHPNYEHAMTPLTQKMQTHCFGRFQIDLPAGSRVKQASVNVNGISIGYKPYVSYEEFEQFVAKRWREVQALTKDNYDRPYVKASVKVEPVKNGVIFSTGHRMVAGSDVYGVDKGPQLFQDTEAYLWRDDLLFEFGKTLNGEERIAALMRRIEVNQEGQPPFRAGLCFGQGFLVTDGFEPAEARVSFTLPGYKDFGLIASQRAFSGEPHKSLLQRKAEKQPMRDAILATALKNNPGLILGGKTHRSAARELAKLNGEEYTGGDTEKKNGFSTSIVSEWEYVGKTNSAEFPEITLEMGIRYVSDEMPPALGEFPTKDKATLALSKEEYFALWDAILKSLRPRPGAF